MGLVPKFNAAGIRKYAEQQKEVIEQAIINRLKFVGEKFVINARNNGSYTDRTGNLRSSVGYVILKNGQQIFETFPGEKPEGRSTGIKVALNAAEKFPEGIVLIVVAGMEYAAAVESKNRDVLTASSITAESDLRKSLQELKSKL